MRVIYESLSILIEESDEGLRLFPTGWRDGSAVPALQDAVASTKA